MQHRKFSKYIFKIGNGYHDVIVNVDAYTKVEAMKKAEGLRGVPTDKITLMEVKPLMVLKRINGKLAWVDERN